MNLSDKGVLLIKGFEGCVLHPYRDQAGIPTIGWGSTRYENGARVKMTDPAITQARADSLFLIAVKVFSDEVARLVKVPITQNQHDALTSFNYNTGMLAKSSALILLNNGQPQLAADRLLLWNKITLNGEKVVSDTLVKRRAKERQVFLTAA